MRDLLAFILIAYPLYRGGEAIAQSVPLVLLLLSGVLLMIRRPRKKEEPKHKKRRKKKPPQGGGIHTLTTKQKVQLIEEIKNSI